MARPGVLTDNAMIASDNRARRDSNLRLFTGVSEAGARSRNPEAQRRISKAVTCGNYGAPGEIRTPDLLLRRQSLYPSELRAHPGVFSLHGEVTAYQRVDKAERHCQNEGTPDSFGAAGNG